MDKKLGRKRGKTVEGFKKGEKEVKKQRNKRG